VKLLEKRKLIWNSMWKPPGV